MNIQLAATLTLDGQEGRVQRDSSGNSIEHARWMLSGIIEGYIQHEKAHRWLGYAQALIVMLGESSLDEMKRINQRAS